MTTWCVPSAIAARRVRGRSDHDEDRILRVVDVCQWEDVEIGDDDVPSRLQVGREAGGFNI